MNRTEPTAPSGTIACLSCVKTKRSNASPAREMYISALFTKMLAYAESLHPKAIYILSAKYGLLNQYEVIEPYEKTLKQMSADERALWGERVLARLREVADLENDHFVFLAGKPYRENLLPHIRHYSIPMEGLSFGQQLQWLSERTR